MGSPALIGEADVTYTAGLENPWGVSGMGRHQLAPILAHLEQESRQAKGPVTVHLVFRRPRRGRTLAQNRLMWELLGILANTLSGGEGDVTDLDCYLDILEDYGGEFQYFEIDPKAYAFFKRQFRLVRILDTAPDGRILCKAYAGSSQLDTAQMSRLIDGIFDRLAQLGAQDPRAAWLWQEWRGSRSTTHGLKAMGL